MVKYMTVALVTLMITFSFAGEGLPKFSDYPVTAIYKGKRAKVKTAPDDAEHFRRALVQAGTQPVNFAGHYVVFQYSCGGGCITASVIDVITGEVAAGLPGSYVAGDEPEPFITQY